MRGGRVLWLIDRIQAEMDSLGQTGTTVAIRMSLTSTTSYSATELASIPIWSWTFRRHHPGGDRVCGNQPKRELLPWYYFPPVGKHG